MKLNMSNERLVAWGWAIGIIIFFSGFAISWCWEGPRSAGRRFQGNEAKINYLSRQITEQKIEGINLRYDIGLLEWKDYASKMRAYGIDVEGIAE